jgi:hypothetical protein
VQYRAGLPARRPKIRLLNLGQSCNTQSCANGLRRRTYAYLRRNCHAKPIGWLADGFGSSSPICPATQSGLHDHRHAAQQDDLVAPASEQHKWYGEAEHMSNLVSCLSDGGIGGP